MPMSRGRRGRGDARAHAGHRRARLSRLIADTLDVAVRAASDPALSDVSVVDVELSPDGHHAFARYVAAAPAEAAIGLGRASALLRHAVSDRLQLRRVPELHFVWLPAPVGVDG